MKFIEETGGTQNVPPVFYFQHMKFYGLLFSFLLLLSSCHKEEYAIVKQLAGKYNCMRRSYCSNCMGPYYPDTSYLTIEFKAVPVYPQRIKLELEGRTYLIPIDFNTMEFGYPALDTKKIWAISGRFFGGDSVEFTPYLYECNGCGVSGYKYLAVKQ